MKNGCTIARQKEVILSRKRGKNIVVSTISRPLLFGFFSHQRKAEDKKQNICLKMDFSDFTPGQSDYAMVYFSV